VTCAVYGLRRSLWQEGLRIEQHKDAQKNRSS
jgi:hypothetical protein